MKRLKLEQLERDKWYKILTTYFRYYIFQFDRYDKDEAFSVKCFCRYIVFDTGRTDYEIDCSFNPKNEDGETNLEFEEVPAELGKELLNEYKAGKL